jgi:hypothetical protein
LPPSLPAAAAEPLPEPQQPASNVVARFVEEYQHVWALLITSDYQKELVADWAGRIPLQAWSYGLKQCADHRKVGNWRYLESILSRVEREGLSPPCPVPVMEAVPLGFSVKGLLASGGTL